MGISNCSRQPGGYMSSNNIYYVYAYLRSKDYSKTGKAQTTDSLKGKEKPPEMGEKIRKSWLTRLPATTETREKWSERNRQRKWTTESRIKAGATSRGTFWWNNGKEQCRSANSPGTAWGQGRIPKALIKLDK